MSIKRNIIIKKYYYLYKIINTTNNKFYFGIHGTNNLNDNYMGSSKDLTEDIKLLGINNFVKEIIEFFPDYKLAALKEKEIVTKELIRNTQCYNKMIGGLNHNDPTEWLNIYWDNLDNIKAASDKKRELYSTIENREKISNGLKKYYKNNPEIKDIIKNRFKKLYENKEFVDKQKVIIKEKLNNPIIRQKMSDNTKLYFSNIENRLAQSDRTKQYIENNPEYKAEKVKQLQAWRNDPIKLAKHKEKIKNKLKDKNYLEIKRKNAEKRAITINSKEFKDKLYQKRLLKYSPEQIVKLELRDTLRKIKRDAKKLASL